MYGNRSHGSWFRARAWLGALGVFVALGAACDEPASDDPWQDAAELDLGPPPGKDDSAGVAGLPVQTFADSQVWEIRNQWEDTDTANARQAGMAWEADSGLTWDEKYARWVASMQAVPGVSVAKTFELTTPWGKTMPAPKLDCADVALTLRITFAAWYGLPFYITMYDHGAPVYFGHFGIRTASGRWNGMPAFRQAYEDYSDTPADEALADWPQDDVLRSRGVQDGDAQPFLGAGARTGTYLDEIHLNKRAGHFTRLALIFAGSMHLADTLNTYNLQAEAIRPGDIMLWRWQRQGVGHTMLTMRVDAGPGETLEVQSVFGNLPPNQPVWDNAKTTARNFTDVTAGGLDETTMVDYAPNGGGLKRWRVAKPVAGKWVNTWMAADEASWIDSRDHQAMHERVQRLEQLLGELTPEEHRDLLLSVIESKREHLRAYPASCSARTKREEAFAELYAVATESLGMTVAQVDAQWRALEDYVFAELIYEQSKTCCWNASTPAMYQTVMDLNASLQQQALDDGTCVEPLVFKARDGGYDAFRDFRPEGWLSWSEGESCPQRNVEDDVEAPTTWTPWCALSVPPVDAPVDDATSCQGHCGGQSADQSCWCDDQCAQYGDCCTDLDAVCG